MSLFKFAHQVNARHPVHASVYFLNEQKNIVPSHEAHRFIVKQKTKDGFREFFGVIKDINAPEPPLQLGHRVLEEADENLYREYHLDQELDLAIEGKQIPLYIPKDFLDTTPLTFAGVTRKMDKIAKNAGENRQFIHDYYQKNLIPHHVSTLQEIKCTSVAALYSYLNGGKKWVEGMEYEGYVDALWEIGGYVSASIDTTQFDIHSPVHECGHSVSYYLIDELFEEWYSISVDKSEAPPSDYAKTEVSEDFAESYGFYFGPSKDGKSMQKKCPKRWAFMQKLDKMGNAALVKNLTPTSVLTKRFKKYDKVVW